MSWTKKDWEDLTLMIIGSCIGVGIFGFGITPLLEVELIGAEPFNYVIAAVMGTVFGYLTRFCFRMFGGVGKR